MSLDGHDATGAMVWLDGVRCTDGRVALLRDDPGWTLGWGVFETLPLQATGPVLLDRHLDRLAQSCALTGLPAPDRDRLTRVVSQAWQVWTAQTGRLRVQVTAGGHVIVSVGPVRPPRARVTVHAMAWPSPPFPPARAKHTSRAGACLAPAHHGVDEVFRLDNAGHVLEGTWSNAFCLTAGSLATCPDDGRILPGITRAIVLAAAEATGLAVDETAPHIDTPHAEWWVSSSLSGLVPVHRLQGVVAPAPGRRGRSLQQAVWTLAGRPGTPPNWRPA